MEPGCDLADLADLPAGECVADAIHLLMEREHERLPERNGRRLGRREHPTGFLGCDAERLLAQDRLARLERGDRPLGVQAVGQRDVDRLYPEVGDDLLVAEDTASDAVLGGPAPGARLVAACDRDREAVARLAERREEGALGDTCRAEDAPADRILDRVHAAITSARGG